MLSIGQWLILITQLITVVGAVWKVGSLLNDIKSEVKVLNANLSNLKERVDRHEARIGD
jgi:hypothetical protein